MQAMNDGLELEESSLYCPYCQVPYSLVHLTGKNMHLVNCITTQRKVQPNCPNGIRCKSEMVCHYRKYNHKELALERSKVVSTTKVVELTISSDEDDFKTSTCVRSKTAERKVTKEKLLLSTDDNNENDLQNLSKGSSNGRTPCKKPSKAFSSSTPHKYPTNNKINKSKTNGCSNTELSSPLQPAFDFEAELAPQPKKKASVNRKLQYSNTDEKADKQDNLTSTQHKVIKKEPGVDLENRSFSTCFLSPIKSSKSFNIKRESDEEVGLSPKKRKTAVDSMETGSQKGLSPVKKVNFPGCDALKKNMKNGNIAKFFGFKVQEKQDNGIFKPSKKSRKSHPTTNDSIPIPREKGKRTCPFYKKVEKTKIAVDAFSYGEIEGIEFYFLSHFHYDHYMGLSRKWKNKIYCSEVTGELVKLKYRSISHLVVTLPTQQATHVGDVEVTLMEANHCPGAVIFVFQLPSGNSILHTGDFRADERMISELTLQGYYFSVVYLDTTYLDPQYTFPSQDEVVRFASSKICECLEKYPNTLVISGTYFIGKEKIFLDFAEKLKRKIYVTKEKYRTMSCFKDERIKSMLTTDATQTNLRVVQMKQLQWPSLKEILLKSTYKKLVAIKPTGWTFQKCARAGGLESLKISFDKSIVLMELPYSEHSSFSELKSFVQALKPGKIIPTVNVNNPATRKMMSSYLDEWKRP